MKHRIWVLAVDVRLGMVLAVLSWGLFAPAAAPASCGDYLILKSGGAKSPHDAPRSAAFQEGSPAQSDALPMSSRPRTPCRGPHCSASNPTTNPAPPAVPVQPTDDLAIPTKSFPFTNEASHRLMPELRDRPGTSFSLDVFRPPRIPVLS